MDPRRKALLMLVCGAGFSLLLFVYYVTLGQEMLLNAMFGNKTPLMLLFLGFVAGIIVAIAGIVGLVRTGKPSSGPR